MHKLAVKIAGLVIRIDSEIDLNNFTDLALYEKFHVSSNGSSDCRLVIKNNTPHSLKFSLDNLQTIFNPRGNWRLFKNQDQPVLLDGRPMRCDNPDSLVVFNQDYSAGTVYRRYVIELFRRFLDQFIIINLLSQRKGLLMHSAGVISAGKGLVFAGHSGAGKSTMVKLFCPSVGAQNILNDDRIVIRYQRKKWRIHGTPWHGEVPLALPGSVELQALFFLEKQPRNYLRRLSTTEAYCCLVKHCLIPAWDEERMSAVLNTFGLLIKQIPVYEVGFVPKREIVDLIGKTMNSQLTPITRPTTQNTPSQHSPVPLEKTY